MTVEEPIVRAIERDVRFARFHRESAGRVGGRTEIRINRHDLGCANRRRIRFAPTLRLVGEERAEGPEHRAMTVVDKDKIAQTGKARISDNSARINPVPFRVATQNLGRFGAPVRPTDCRRKSETGEQHGRIHHFPAGTEKTLLDFPIAIDLRKLPRQLMNRRKHSLPV